MRPGEPGWAVAILSACLDELDDTPTLGPERVEVLDSWPIPEDGFCVVYRHPWHAGLTIGYCARADPPEEWDDFYDAAADIAYFCISEPRGAIEAALKFDEDGVGWFGCLGDELPRRPDSQ